MKDVIIFGKMGSGKETVANYFFRVHRGETGQIPVIKKLSQKMNEIIIDLTGRKPTRNEKQSFGQFCRTLFGEDVWNDRLYKEYRYKYKNVPVIIEDGRQVNEFEFWKDKGFVTIYVDAPYDLRFKRLRERDGYDQSFFANHETETGVEKIKHWCDVTIVNDKTVEDLRSQLYWVYNRYLVEEENYESNINR